ncbi:hypothetical protein B0O99DRAFT_624943 [Bisporella sp. PMI_857]|nr:hypothetical protein B0O99DRAFT_624943 [Bisporella sp. PMI_857]
MDETSAELGYSIENALFGGKIVAWPLYSMNELVNRDSQPILALCIGSWPDDHDHATPTLVEPALGQPETVIPLSVSYFEALQREDYWAAGFSSPGILRPPPPNTGVAKINGEWRELEQLERGYMEQTGSGKQIADMIKLSPNERLVYLGQYMREEQTKRLWEILEERNKVTARVEFQEEFCARQTSTDMCGQYSLLVGALEDLFVPHKEGILLLLSLEQSGQTLIDTRNAHVSFTRNFRKCVRRTLEILKTNKLDDLVQRLDKLEIQLENVRLQVHDPVEAISRGQIGASTQEENYELNLLRKAVDTPDEDLCLRACDTIIASLGSNLWVKSIARALKGTRCEKLPKMDRINNLHRAKETLKKITPPAQLTVERDQWVRRCEENIVIFQNDKEPKAQT